MRVTIIIMYIGELMLTANIPLSIFKYPVKEDRPPSQRARDEKLSRYSDCDDGCAE